MTRCPTVTVLMTVYDGLPYLGAAIDSVLAQTFRDFELLIVDDASTDGSVACVRAYDDPRIRMVRNERNLGQVRSLNRGLELAAGEFVARIDQDDLALPERLARQVAVLRARADVAVVDTYGLTIDAAGRATGTMVKPWLDAGTFLGLVLVGGQSLAHASVMFRRDTIRSLGGYDETLAPAEDYDLWARVVLAGGGVVVVPEILAMYRFHGTQQTAARADVRRTNLRRAHERTLTSVWPHGDGAAMAALLRGDASLWAAGASRTRVREVLAAIGALLTTMRARYRLSDAEARRMEIVVRRFVAGAALRAVLGGHRGTLACYRFALRGGIAMLGFPSVLLYPVAFAFSPCLTPSTGARLLRGVEIARVARTVPRAAVFLWRRRTGARRRSLLAFAPAHPLSFFRHRRGAD